MCRDCSNQETSNPQPLQATLPDVGLPPLVPPVAKIRSEIDETACNGCGAYGVDRESDNGDEYCKDCYDERFVECDGCGEETDRDDSTRSEDGNDYCDQCYHERYVTCDACSCEVGIDEYRSVEDRRFSTLCEGCYDEHFCTCSACDTDIRINDSQSFDGDYYCDSCFGDRFGNCDRCGGAFHQDDLHYSESRGADYCYDCHRGDDDIEFNARRFRPTDNTFERTASRRRFGVELETSECEGAAELEGEVYFGCKEDGSIDGREFVSAILDGDKGLDAIDDFCRRANRLGFAVDGKCGFHAHFDVGDLSDDELRSVACAYASTYYTWSAFVGRERRNNMYCKRQNWGCDDIADAETFAGFAIKPDRYMWLNLNAYNAHNTFEVRLHSATLDGDKVCNWVKAHIRFIDAVSKMTVAQVRQRFEGKTAQENFEALADIWADADLTEFYRARAEKFGASFTAPASREPQPASQVA